MYVPCDYREMMQPKQLFDGDTAARVAAGVYHGTAGGSNVDESTGAD